METTIREVRAEGMVRRVATAVEQFVDADVHDDIDISVIQIHSETLNKVDAAIRRLEEGLYGECADCGNAIAPERLRALPFAVRCLSCQMEREATTNCRRVPLSRLEQLD
jgi:DnaK suppressor protein